MINLLDILNESSPKVGQVRFIAVDGHGGSGKSTLGKLLSKQLGAELIHTDDFASPDNPTDWWPKIIEQVFKPIARGDKTLSYQPASWWENHHPEPITHQPVTDIMVLEGVTSSRLEFSPYLSVQIYVDTPIAICMQRGIARDLNTGKSETELNAIWKEWLAEEVEYMERDTPKERADIVVDGTKSFADQITLPY